MWRRCFRVVSSCECVCTWVGKLSGCGLVERTYLSYHGLCRDWCGLVASGQHPHNIIQRDIST